MTNSSQLTRFDTTSLNRALLGFDSMFNNFEHRIANQINQNYPPYNILKHTEDSYEIQIAVTGFEKDEITVKIDQNQLIVEGAHAEKTEDDSAEYLHRGLATRNFTRYFALAQYMEVGEGSIKNGILTIEVKRIVPDSLKPRTLKIKAQ